MAKTNIFMIGFMGSGKTTVSKELGKRYGFEEIEMDDYIAAREGMSISDIFARYGEARFRSIETETVKKLSGEEGKVISCGGGAALAQENVDAMKEHGFIILLEASPETVYERVKDSTDRPLLNGNMNVEHIRTLMARREKRYREVADYVISTDGKTVEEICAECKKVVEKLNCVL